MNKRCFDTELIKSELVYLPLNENSAELAYKCAVRVSQANEEIRTVYLRASDGTILKEHKSSISN